MSKLCFAKAKVISYLRTLLIASALAPNVVSAEVPVATIAATNTIVIMAKSKAYSTAVAPDSFFSMNEIFFSIVFPLDWMFERD